VIEPSGPKWYISNRLPLNATGNQLIPLAKMVAKEACLKEENSSGHKHFRSLTMRNILKKLMRNKKKVPEKSI